MMGKNGMYGKASREERLLLRFSSYALSQDVPSSAELLHRVVQSMGEADT